MSTVIRHSPDHVPAIGSAGLEPQDLREGYCATLCFVTAAGEFFDVHVTRQHLEHLARLLVDPQRFSEAQGVPREQERNSY